MPQKDNRRKKLALRIGIALVLLLAAVIIAMLLNRRAEEATYRLDYPELISQYAGEYDLDPYLVAAVIHVESGNRETVISARGAVGLMQVMPSTGEWIAGKLGESFDEKMLLEADINIRYGCWYLRFIMDRISNRDACIAAYNAGHNAVMRWLDDVRYTDDGETLSDIPYEETRNYVERVNRAYEKYKKLYPKAFD